jgi:hypothetical protein
MTAFIQKWFGGPVSGGTDVAGRSLRLTGVPENFWVLIGIVAVFGLLSWVIVRSYRGEGRTPMKVKMAIAGVRLAVLLVLLFVVLQPALVIRYNRIQTSAVVVLVDDTLSMRWRDRYPDARERGALAAAAQVADGRLDGEDRLMRQELVKGALLRGDGVLAQLAKDHPLAIFRFGVTGKDATSYVEPIGSTDEAIPAAAKRKGGAGDPALAMAATALGKLQSDGYNTNLGRAMRELLNRTEGRRVAAIVVISDGQNTGTAYEAGRLSGVLQMTQQRQIPVYAVNVGDPKPPRNIVVAQLQGPREVRQKSKLSFTAFVTQRSMPRRSVEVRLMRCRVGGQNWEETGCTASVELGGEPAGKEGGSEDAMQEVNLATDAPAEVGNFSYKARIEPQAEEMILSDNEASATVRVTDQKLTVLLVSGDAGWEFQYLRNYLLKMSEHYGVTVWQQNADPRFNQDASTGMKRAGLPSTRQEVFAYDVIIMYDPKPTPDSMDARFVGMLEEFVSVHHGGVAYLVGNKHTGASFAPGGEFEPLGKLLPVVMAREDSAVAAQMDANREAFRISPTPAGFGHPLLQLAGKSEENARTWKRLPGLYRSQPVSRAKTLATVLAVSGDPGRMTGDQQREPLIAVQYYGKGRVLYMGFDSTWRWRRVDESATYERFWANAMDFLGSGRLEKKRILITTDGELYDAGAEVRVRVEAYDRDFAPVTTRSLTLEMRAMGGASSSEHTVTSEKPGFYTGVIAADRTGLFELDAKRDAEGRSDWTPDDVAARRIEIRLPKEEFLRPEANADTLRELAGSSERCVALGQIDSLAAMIPPAKLTVVSEVSHTVWDTMGMLVVFGLLLLTEWALRKLWHMM